MSEAQSIPHLLLVLAALLVTSKMLGALAQRAGQPAVLGELLAGVVLGASVFGLLDATDPAIAALSELGVIVLLFEIGLNTDLRSMTRVLGTATTVALVRIVSVDARAGHGPSPCPLPCAGRGTCLDGGCAPIKALAPH